jgi:hypothetical protein
MHDDIFTVFIANGYFLAGDTAKGLDVINNYYEVCKAELDYFAILRPGFRSLIDYEIRYNMQAIEQMRQLTEIFNRPLSDDMQTRLSNYQIVFAKEDPNK